MKRRDFITILGGAAATQVISPSGVRAATSPKRWIIGLPYLFGSEAGQRWTATFLQGLQELGYVVDRDLDLQFRDAGGDWDGYPAFVEKEIIPLRPNIIFAYSTADAVATRKATSTIPIVCAALAHPVRLGLIKSEARPEGNVTGIMPYVAGLPAKQIELAREMVPGASTVGLLTSSKDPKAAPQTPELEAAGKAIGLNIVAADVNRPEEIDDALRELKSKHADVVIVLQGALLASYCSKIAAMALAMRLPTICGYREHVIAGSLISYGVDLSWCYHRAGYFIDKILRGAAPADLPIEFPTKFPLSINLRRHDHSAFAALARRRGDRVGRFRHWHQTDMLPRSPHVCCWGRNGPSSHTPRGLSLTLAA